MPRVLMHHPVTGGSFTAQTEAAAAAWESRGWVRSDPTDPGATFDIHSATVEELRDYASEHDIDLAGAARKAEIIEAIQAATATPQES